jgi:hypothetical protein
MFSLFHDPFYYRPTYWFNQPRYSRRQSLFERYLDALDQRFFSTLVDDAAQLLGLESREGAGQSDGAPAPAPASASAPAPEPAGDAQAPKPESKLAQRPQPQITPFGRQYVSVTRSTFDGHDYVEEHREKVTGADGQTRIATRRRLGDRWYENEVHVDKDGQKTERETWHNVGDDDIETFKREWSEKHSNQPALKTESSNAPPSPSAIAPPSDGAANPATSPQ